MRDLALNRSKRQRRPETSGDEGAVTVAIGRVLGAELGLTEHLATE
jgi:hypothetical protein